jgi:2,3-bisphosphoglycerate-dependent phosphoglycerate mutase
VNRRTDLAANTVEYFSPKKEGQPRDHETAVIMPTRVLLLRHAESANPLIFHGAESDVALSERGQRQADAVAEVLAAYKPDRLVSSGMRRARETAAPIARACGLTLEIEPQLHERRVGALSGTPTQRTEGVWPDTLKHWLSGDMDYAPDGAESYNDIYGRVMPIWSRLTSGPGQTLVVVAHGIVCKVILLNTLPDYGLADWHRLGPILNVGITELLCDDGAWHCVRLNEVPEAVRRLAVS